MGFMKGTLTSTASATKFSISRSMGRLYLALTYSGLAAYRQATRPPRGVMPTRSPIPRTAIKRWDQCYSPKDQRRRWTYKCRYGLHQPPELCTHLLWLEDKQNSVLARYLLT